MAQPERKLSLQAFLQLLTSNGLPVKRSMAVAGKIYKEVNTPNSLGELTDVKLVSLGVSDKEDRKLVLGAVSKAGYRAKVVEKVKTEEGRKRQASIPCALPPGNAEETKSSTATASGSSVSYPTKKAATPPPTKKRKVAKKNDQNEFLPDKIHEQGDEVGSLEFDEILDEEMLKGKFVVINRAPIMMAWSFLVAERMGFQREEALSIASVYTEMNAISKGASLGIYPKSSTYSLSVLPNGKAAPHNGGAQPYVDLMGRRIPLIQISSVDGSHGSGTISTSPSTSNATSGPDGNEGQGQWRALSPEKGMPVSPASTCSYITRSLRQMTPAIMGAMRLLADSYANELNKVGWELYADFRPEVDGWGKRGQVSCDRILGLRKKQRLASGKKEQMKEEGESDLSSKGGEARGDEDSVDEDRPKSDAIANPPEPTTSVEEYEAALEDFDADELSALP
ncbi:uncharacterized protein STEHIDRAFT_167419 [Stereum hirsutum FP-91666 SS1]|uniref:uncharacterized protein n=1 Tax=Stereum hirsutum (strain FP-91666) TaxID=721885 RepID=UPI000440D0DC|nr:uncharacterized protein STEHIDRAFT_167419 [Stereum hirsutum FP-91666 SS1]EIM88056.1 hypothetical protein STEHIDRAFT_167419 [Stereum hirsutum FP-91666 SS1]